MSNASLSASGNSISNEEFSRLQNIYEAALDNTPDFVYVIGVDYRFIYANKALLEMWGRTKQDSVGRSLLELGYEPWHAHMHEREIDEVVKNKKAIRGVVPFTGTHGNRIYEYIFSPIFGKSGEVTAIAGTTRDITEQKKTEEALKQTEERITMALNSGAVLGTWVWDVPNDNIVGDERFLRTFSLNNPSENNTLSFAKALESIHPDDIAYVKKTVKAALAKGHFFRAEYRLRKSSNRWRWVEASGTIERDVTGNPIRFPGVLIDIDERKRSEQDLRRLNDTLEIRVADRIAELSRKEAWLRTIFETSYQYQGLLSLDGILLEANSASLAGINATLGDVTGKHFADTPWFSATPGMSEAIRAAIALVTQGETVRREITLNLPTGERTFDFSMRPIRDKNNVITSIVPEAVDLTEHRKDQEELRMHRDNLAQLVEMQTRDLKTAKELAESANIAKTDFLANMSHEIRTPMNAIIGLSNILSVSKPLTAKQTEYIKTLQMSADSLLMLINDLLDIAKIESRSVDLERTPFSIVKLAEETVSMMTVRAQEKGLIFTVEQKCACINTRSFIGDPNRLRQVLLNLCSNAIKFTEKGRVHIDIECEKSADPMKEIIIFVVRDTGIGIAPDKQETIFHKFVQADSSINRKYGGTGLGLAITKTLTEIMGGSITVESELQKGSAFKVRIPFEIVPNPTPSSDCEITQKPPTERQDEKRIRILLVEDYLPNIVVASSFLEQFNYRYEVAVNGLEAIEKIKQDHFDLVLMDVQMHAMNGFDATHYIRNYEKQHNKPRVPIIGMTAHALVGDRERCLGAGMDDYIAKPFNPVDLKNKITTVIKK